MNLKKNIIEPLLLLVVLPNIFFLLAAEYFHLGRSLINLDYLFAALLVTSPLSFIGYILFAIFLLIDVLALVSQIFQFVRLDNLFYLSAFLADAPAAYQIATALSAIIILVFFYGVFCIKKHTNAAQTLICFNIAICLYALSFYSDTRSIEEQRVWRVDNPPLVGSPSYYTWRLRSGLFFQNMFEQGQAFSDQYVKGATSNFVTDFEQDKYKKILLIVNESWGAPTNKKINSWITAPIRQMQGNVEILNEGNFNFYGATVAGELRELCNLAPLHFNLKDVSEGFEKCLPHKLQQQGYNTTAFHAASGVLYDRIYWYKRAGFNKHYFFEHLNWNRRCYSYPGGCDVEIIEDVTTALNQPGKQFVYWLTLNSHAIYDERDIVIDVFDCANFGIELGTQSCRNLKLQAQFFYVLAQQIAENKLQGVRVIVVSDHAPVITNKKEKNTYFVDNRINWVSFKVTASQAGFDTAFTVNNN